MIDTHKHQTALKVYKDHMNDLWIYKDRNEEHQHGAYKFRQKDWQVKRFINDVHRGGFALKTMKNAYDDAMEEVKRLREGIEKALIPTDTNPIIHPLVKLNDLRKALKEMIE